MEFEASIKDGFISGNDNEIAEKGGVFERSKTSLRMHYEAEVEVIRQQIGDLELIRSRLGLSARKICQLLMVDPSAWTRWTKSGHQQKAPPHIYRALQWYMALNDKLPGLTPQYFIGKSSSELEVLTDQKIESKISSTQSHLQTQMEERLLGQWELTTRGLQTLQNRVEELKNSLEREKRRNRNLLVSVLGLALFSTLLIVFMLKR